jgi:hypothetical protein
MWLLKSLVQTAVGKSHPPSSALPKSRLLEENEGIILNIAGVSQTALVFQLPWKGIPEINLI